MPRDGMASVWKFLKLTGATSRDDMSIIFSRMFLDGRIRKQQEHGIMVCRPKNDISTILEEYRQNTLLNIEYKILALIRTNRLKPTLCLLHSSQYFGVPSTTVFDAFTTVRDSLFYVDLTHSQQIFPSPKERD